MPPTGAADITDCPAHKQHPPWLPSAVVAHADVDFTGRHALIVLNALRFCMAFLRWHIKARQDLP